MPATEQTWRDLKILHVVFAVTAIVLLVCTVAMLAADHDRPWKKYARGFRDLETWSAAARIEQQDLAGYRARGQELTVALAEAPVPEGAGCTALEIVRVHGRKDLDRSVHRGHRGVSRASVRH